MENYKDWIGIQFNWIEGTEKEKIDLVDFLNPYKNFGIEVTKDHITIGFTSNELKRLNNNTLDNRKVNIVKQAIKKYLAYSDYTNIYTHTNTEKVIVSLADFIKNEMKGESRINTEVIKDKAVFTTNFEEILTAPKVFKIIRKSPVVIFYNELYKFVVNRNFALDQTITLQIALEDKYEWGSDADYLNLSTQFDLIVPT